MGWYYAASPDAEYWHCADSREQAIHDGASYAEIGGTYAICEAFPQGPYRTLFDADDLAEHIENSNEDRCFEDGFIEESGLTNAKLQPLVDKINALWTEFIDQHKPTSNALDIKRTEIITKEA